MGANIEKVGANIENLSQPLQKTWTVAACLVSRMDSHLLSSWILWNYAAGIEHFVIVGHDS